MSGFVRRLLVCVLLVGLCRVAWARDLVLVEEGQPKAAIVVPADAPKEEQLAAGELQKYLEAMSGAKLEVVATRPKDKVAILIGSVAKDLVQDLDRRLEADELTLLNDAFLIEARDNALIIAGARPRATQFGVSHFLESLGVRWYFPGTFGEVVPKRATISTPVASQVVRPDCDMRDIWYAPEEWLIHRKVQRHDEALHHGHAWARWIGKEREERPELRGLVKGERKGILNFSHPEAPGIMAKNIIAHLDGTDARTVSIGCDDGPVEDETPESVALGVREFSNPFSRFPADTDQVLHVYNKLVPLVLEKHPDVVFGALVYANMMSPPRREAVHPRIAWVAAPLAECPLHPTTSNTCPRRIHFRRQIENWAKLTDRLYIYEYDPLVIWHGNLAPRVELIRANYPYYKRIGVRGFNMEARANAFSESGLNYYVMSRLWWDMDADVDAILDEFCRTFYAEAAQPMREWIRITQGVMRDVPAEYTGNEDHNIPFLFTPEVMARADEALQAAEGAAESPEVKQRVHVARLTHEHLAAWLRSVELAAEAKFTEAADAIDAMYRIKEELHAIEPSLAAGEGRWDMTSKGPPWPRGVQGLYRRFADLAGQAQGSKNELVAMTPRKWSFKYDPENVGISRGWADTTTEGWRQIDTTAPWDYQGVLDHPEQGGCGWYRTTVEVPARFAGRPLTLYFTRLFGRELKVWVDGKLAHDETLPYYFWFNYDHAKAIDVTGALKAGEKHAITMRIYKEIDWGGPYGRIFIYSPPEAEEAG